MYQMNGGPFNYGELSTMSQNLDNRETGYSNNVLLQSVPTFEEPIYTQQISL